MANARLKELLEQTAGLRRRSRLGGRATIERFFRNQNNVLFPGATDSSDRLGNQGPERQELKSPRGLSTRLRTPSPLHPPYRVGMVEAVHLECRIDNQPIDSPLWCCSVIEGYSRLLMAVCFTPQPRSDTTTLQLLNQLIDKSNWIPDVLFFRGNTDCPMVRLRARFYASGELRVKGVSFLVAAPPKPQFADVLHFPLDLSFAYVLIGDRWVLALPKRHKSMIADQRPDDLGPYFPM